MRKTLGFTVLMVVLVASCGPYKVQVDDIKVDGNITHTIAFNFDDLKKYFKAECEEEVAPADVAECVDAKVGKFLTFMSTPLPSPSATP